MNIVLIGMSGAGKSTLGVLLAKTLGMNYVDTDIVIQQSQGRLLQEIIDTDGIYRFIKIEEQAVTGLTLTNCVVATGGSVVYSDAAMRFLKENGRVVYLHVPYEEIDKRLKNISDRGIVVKEGKSLRGVYDERVPLYQKYCDVTVDCTNKDTEECVREILKSIG